MHKSQQAQRMQQHLADMLQEQQQTPGIPCRASMHMQVGAGVITRSASKHAGILCICSLERSTGNDSHLESQSSIMNLKVPTPLCILWLAKPPCHSLCDSHIC
jgi:hypothetical protein